MSYIGFGAFEAVGFREFWVPGVGLEALWFGDAGVCCLG